MNLSDHFLQTLDARFGRYLELFKTCRKEFSEEAIHDLRVATRRLLAFTELLNRFHSPSGYKKIRRTLKKRLDGFDELRDVQVMIRKVSEVQDRMPAVAPFWGAMKNREESLLEKAREQIQKQKTDMLSKWFGGAARELRKQPDPEKFSAELFRAADLAYALVRRRYDRMSKAEASSIHRLRIAFKRFRYLMEMMAPLMPDFPPRILPDMHAYQTRLGDIQDMEVLLTWLDHFYEAGGKGVRKYYLAAYAKAMDTYWTGRGCVKRFWRPRPDAPFFWNKPSGKGSTGETK